MKSNKIFVAFMLFLLLKPCVGNGKDPYPSFSSDINACLFREWVNDGILKKEVDCAIQQLCYGKYDEGRALFASCYNTKTLIPEFTGHKLVKDGTEGEPGMVDPGDDDYDWKTDQGLVNAGIPVAAANDYDPHEQGNLYPNFDIRKNQFLARGHLTPNRDYKDANHERSFTFIVTNCAPQWQPFNGGNWNNMETAVIEYAKEKGRTLYIFTGTGGRAEYKGKDIMLNKRVVTPKYYWKAVCDPDAKVRQSVVLVAENSPGEISTNKVQGCAAPKVKPQTLKLGIIQCYSMEEAAEKPEYADFKLPSFSDAKCQPSMRGTFLDNKLATKLK